jgi:hypothetical protein
MDGPQSMNALWNNNTIKNLLIMLACDMKSKAVKHDMAARYYNGLNGLFTIPPLILSVIMSSWLIKDEHSSEKDMIGMSMIISVCSALQTYFKPAMHGERHRNMANSYHSAQNNIIVELSRCPVNRRHPDTYIEHITLTKKGLDIQSPDVPLFIECYVSRFGKYHLPDFIIKETLVVDTAYSASTLSEDVSGSTTIIHDEDGPPVSPHDFV